MEIDNNLLDKFIDIGKELAVLDDTYLNKKIGEIDKNNIYDIVNDLKHDMEISKKILNLTSIRLSLMSELDNQFLYNLYYMLADAIINEKFEDAENIKTQIQKHENNSNNRATI